MTIAAHRLRPRASVRITRATMLACFALTVVTSVWLGARQALTPVPARPQDAMAAILSAFRTHEIVALTDPHGNVQVQAFLLGLVRDPRFAEAADDIVIEAASARYQDVIDRFVRGDDVERRVLRRAWEDHTVPNSLGTQAEELIHAVRTVNVSRPARKLRVIAGDPPIDWDNITSSEDHRRWIGLRDSYPADLVRRLVLDRGRRALLVYGQGHLQRQQIMSNYDMSSWQAQTVVSLLERNQNVRLFNIWTLDDRDVEAPAEVSSWPVPSLALLKGTTLGARDFSAYGSGLGGGGRLAVRDDKVITVPRADWKQLPIEEQFDALLYLGPPAWMTSITLPAALCMDREFVAHRLERLSRFGAPAEVENFRRACLR